MTFREFIEQSLADFEEHLRREAASPATDMRLSGARQFALLLLGEPHGKERAARQERAARPGGPNYPSFRRAEMTRNPDTSN
jgi:hypothetical protein